MTRILTSLLCILVASTKAGAETSLQPGDIILQSQSCFMCSLIETEEGLPYSHAGIVAQEPNGALSVLESWTKIDRVTLGDFLSRRKAGTATLIRRPVLKSKFKYSMNALNAWLIARFNQSFLGHRYDPNFSWSNRDELGEKFYCSEFIAKLINPVLLRPLQTKPMHFQKHREYWIKYFQGNPPDGEPGLSPADIARSEAFITVGTL